MQLPDRRGKVFDLEGKGKWKEEEEKEGDEEEEKKEEGHHDHHQDHIKAVVHP